MAKVVRRLFSVGLLNDLVVLGELAESERVLFLSSEVKSIFSNMGLEFALHKFVGRVGDIGGKTESGGGSFEKVHIN